jgi:hypothetical protein
VRWRSYTRIAATFLWAKSRIVLRNPFVINKLDRYFGIWQAQTRRKGIKFCHMVEAGQDTVLLAQTLRIESSWYKPPVISNLHALAGV